MNTQINKFHLSFITALGLVFILAIFSYSKIRAIITSAALVNYTKQITLDLEKISGSLTDAETGQRGYLLTKDKIFLESFNTGLREYPQHIKAVRQLIFDNPEQERKLAAIETLAQRREDHMHKMLEIDKLRAVTVKELLMGKAIMDSLQIEINTMIASEESRLEHTINQHHEQTIIAPLSLLILCLLALATIFTIYWKLNKSLAQARQLKVEAIQQAVYIEWTKEIQESEKKYNMMLMKSPFCFGVMKGENMIITFANNAIKEVWGKGNDVEGKPFLEILPEIIDTSFPSLIQNVMTSGVPYYGYDMLAQINKNGKLEDGYFNFVYQPYQESDNIISGVTIIAIDVTKEVIAKKQVEEVEMRFRKTMEQAPVAICIMRGENHIVELINEKNLEIIGRTKEQVLNKPIFTTVPEGAKQGFEEILNSVFTTGKSYIANEQPLTLFRNGKEESMYLNITYEPLYDDDHEIDRIISVATDVTEQVTARKKIEESEQELRKIKEQSELGIQAGKIGVWFWDVKKDILTWSKEQRKIYGVSDSEVIISATQFNELIFPDDLKRIQDDQSAGNKLEHEYDFRIIRKNDGRTRWIKSRARSILDENGELEVISGVNIDITDQVEALIKIKESEERFRSLAQTLPQMVWVTDEKGNAEFASLRWKEYSGIEPGGEKEWKAIVHPEDYDNINNAWVHSLTTGDIYIFDVRLKNKDGQYRWHTVKGEPVLDKENKIIKWVGAFIDIHEHKIKEEKKDEFISIASHEMKTPLTTAKAYLQMLELSLDENNEDANLYAKKASQSVNRLNELISELLDVSKIRLGKLNYHITTFNFNEMIESTVENIQLTTQTHAIIRTGKVSNEVTGDKDRLQQVVINLLNNAIKYSPGEEKVFIRIEQEINIIKVLVEDTGIGMNKQSLNKIFEKYHRIEEHSVEFQGLGIGLFISYEIIQRHQGKLWAESETGRGSTFYFTIPLNINLP